MGLSHWRIFLKIKMNSPSWRKKSKAEQGSLESQSVMAESSNLLNRCKLGDWVEMLGAGLPWSCRNKGLASPPCFAACIDDILSLIWLQFSAHSALRATLPGSPPGPSVTTGKHTHTAAHQEMASSALRMLLTHESHVLLLQSLPLMAKKGFIRIRDKMSFRGINILFPYKWPKLLEQTEFFYSKKTSSDSSVGRDGKCSADTDRPGEKLLESRGEKAVEEGDPLPQARTPWHSTTCSCGSISSLVKR